MSAVVRRIPRDQRLRVTAKFQHETLRYEGDIFQFVEELITKRLTGKGTFTLNQGGVVGLEFDLRHLVAQDVDTMGGKRTLDSTGE